MDFLSAAVAWALDPAHWSGGDGIPARLGEHLVLSAVPLMAAVLVALPVGLYIGHTGRGAAIAVNVSNIGRALPFDANGFVAREDGGPFRAEPVAVL